MSICIYVILAIVAWRLLTRRPRRAPTAGRLVSRSSEQTAEYAQTAAERFYAERKLIASLSFERRPEPLRVPTDILAPYYPKLSEASNEKA